MNILALSAPEAKDNRMNTKSLSSKTPFSLQSALIQCVLQTRNPNSAWADSNWKDGTYGVLEKNIKMFHSWVEEQQEIKDFLGVKPDILLIGAMSISYKGAIEIAKLMKSIRRDTLIVLGGYHANETMYMAYNSNTVEHHVASPLLQISKQKIDNVFDFVISGEAEFLLAEIGEIVGRILTQSTQLCLQEMVQSVFFSIENNKHTIQGEWMLGMVDNKQEIKTTYNLGTAIDRSQFPSRASVFGVSGWFDVFRHNATEDIRTAHVMDGVAGGCVYNCNFCSEGSRLRFKGTKTSAAVSLYTKFKEIQNAIISQGTHFIPSAFVEDSVLLKGSIKEMEELCEIHNNSAEPMNLRWGAQLTIDLCLKIQQQIKKLKAVGLEYLFIGLETKSPEKLGSKDAKGFDKNIGAQSSWEDRSAEVMKFLSFNGINVGVSIVFGIGETHGDRLELLNMIQKWQMLYRQPVLVSANWGVVHPMKGLNGGTDNHYEYLDWPVKDEYLEALQNYGEASTAYPFSEGAIPTIEKLHELEYLLQEINNYNSLFK